MTEGEIDLIEELQCYKHFFSILPNKLSPFGLTKINADKLF